MRIHAPLTLALLWLPFAGAVQAASVSYYLDQTNVHPQLADNVDYAMVTIDDDTAGQLNFSVSMLPALTSLTSLTGANPAFMEFGFNVVGASPPPLSDASSSNAQWILPSNWSARVEPPNNTFDGFGMFEVSVRTMGQNNRLPVLSFSLLNRSLTLASFLELSEGATIQGNALFAAHITGLPYPGSASAGYFAGSTAVPAAVPLPGPLGLLLVGGLGVMGMARRSQLA